MHIAEEKAATGPTRNARSQRMVTDVNEEFETVSLATRLRKADNVAFDMTFIDCAEFDVFRGRADNGADDSIFFSWIAEKAVLVDIVYLKNIKPVTMQVALKEGLHAQIFKFCRS